MLVFGWPYLDNRLPFSRFGISTSSTDLHTALALLNGSREHFALQCIHIHYPDRDINSFFTKVDSLLSLLSITFDPNEYPGLSIDIGGGFPSDVPIDIKAQLSPIHIPDL